MDKIAIVTIQSQNYGNRLQNYALQEVINSLGYEVETLRRSNFSSSEMGIKRYVKRIAQIILQTKTEKFNSFERNIRYAKVMCTANSVPAGIEKQYKFFVAGSDQLWNPYYDFVGDVDLLSFAEPRQKISYAASFGVSQLPEQVVEKYKTLLSTFRAISVREREGVSIVEKQLGLSAVSVLDPTLLLDSEKWEKVARKTSKCPHMPYAFVYILGETSSSFQTAIQELNQQNILVFDVLQKNKYGKGIEIGPAEFLYLIQHADIVLTNSFHATVFSILFQKPIHTFNRLGLDMSSRIASLVHVLGLENHLNVNGELLIEDISIYKTVMKKLAQERKRSLYFLSDALKTQE